jgi:hypothetical protein
MDSCNIILNGTTANLRANFETPIHLDPGKKNDIALVSLETYNSVANVDSGNNNFEFAVDGNWQSITIPVGAYEILDIASYLTEALANLGQVDVLEITPNLNTLKTLLKIKKPNISVSFKGDNSLRDLLGFESKIYEYNERPHEAVNIVNILKVNSIFVHCDVIGGSYVNGQSSPVLFNFFANVSPGYKIVETPHNLIYLPVTTHVIREIRIWLTDQDDRPLDLRGETVTVRLHLRSM